VETIITLLSPVVPHIADELWNMTGHSVCLLEVAWPTFRPEALEVESQVIVVQVNGKVRSRIDLPVSLSEKEIEARALADERVIRFIEGKPLKKVIVVKRKLVNVVV
jgi:leucyl-tRNA synthetase